MSLLKHKMAFQGDRQFETYRIGKCHVLKKEYEVVGHRYTPAEF